MSYLITAKSKIIYAISCRFRFTPFGRIMEPDINDISFAFQADIAGSHPFIIAIGRSSNLHIKFFLTRSGRFRLIQHINFQFSRCLPICTFTIKREDFFSRILYIQSRRNHPPVISPTGILICAIVSGSLNIFIYRAICLTCKNLALPCTVIVRRGNNLVSPTRAQLIDWSKVCFDIVELIDRIFHNNRRSTRVSSLTSIATRRQILVFTVRTSGESCNCHSCHKNPCKFSHLFHIKIYLGLKILLRFMQK